jgi:hypothetical protein
MENLRDVIPQQCVDLCLSIPSVSIQKFGTFWVSRTTEIPLLRAVV